MRGNHPVDPYLYWQKGSIPAYAGEPPTPAAGPPDPRVYPRVCGGTLADMGIPLPDDGLSPRMRGNRSLAR